MATNTDPAIIEIAIKYINDGQSLDKAIASAQADIVKSAKNSGKKLDKASSTLNTQHMAELRKVEKEHQASQTRILRGYKAFANQFSQLGKKFGQIAAYGTAYTAIYKLIGLFQTGVTTFLEFEQAFTDMGAKLAYSNNEMKKVTKSIYETASATEFGTKAVTEMATAFGKLGFNANEVAESLPVIAKVASATGESLEETAKSIGKVMNTFGIGSEGAGMVGDRMVQSFKNSALDMKTFSTAFSYVGATAASAGTSFNELTAAMEVLASKGLSASKIGTGLRNIFVQLQESGMSLTDILKEVNEQNLEFTDTVALVGTRGATALQILGDAYVDFTDKVKDANKAYGLAMEAAARQQSTLMARWEIFQNTMKSSLGADGTSGENWRENLDTGWATNFVESSTATWSNLTGKGKDNAKRLARNFIEMNKDFVKEYKMLEAANPEKNMPTLLKMMGIGRQDNETSNALYRSLDEALDDQEAAKIAHTIATKLQKIQGDVIKGLSAARASGGVEGGRAYLAQQKDKYTKKGNWDALDFIAGLDNPDIGKYYDDQKKQYESYMKSMNDMKKKYGGVVGLSPENARLYRTNKDKAKAILDEACEDLGPVVTKDMYGYDCKKSRAKADTYDRQYFTTNQDDLRGFNKIDKGLRGAYAAENDPITKAKINDQLLKERKEYYTKVLESQRKYLADRQRVFEGAAEGSAKKKGVAAEIARVEGNITTTEGKLESAQSYHASREYEYKSERYKKDQTMYRHHVATMNALEDKMEVAQNPEEQAYTLNLMLKNNAKYYGAVRSELEKHLTELQATRRRLIGENQSTEGIDDDIANTILDIGTNNANEAGANKNAADSSSKYKDARQKRRVENAQFAVNSLSQLYDIRKAHTDRMLEEAQRQADAEAQIIQDTFDKEKSARESALQSGIISQEDATKAEIRAEKRKQEELNAIAKQQFELQKQARIESLIIDGIVGAAQAAIAAFSTAQWWMAPVAGGLALAASAQAVAAESRRQYVPQIFAEGGMVQGPSHTAGGVPFSVAGRGGYEMEGGEYIVNKKAVQQNFELLEAINGKTRNQKHFATGGYIPESNTPTTDLSIAILQALDRPVRAFVTNQDLAYSESERRALESKINY